MKTLQYNDQSDSNINNIIENTNNREYNRAAPWEGETLGISYKWDNKQFMWLSTARTTSNIGRWNEGNRQSWDTILNHCVFLKLVNISPDKFQQKRSKHQRHEAVEGTFAPNWVNTNFTCSRVEMRRKGAASPVNLGESYGFIHRIFTNTETFYRYYTADNACKTFSSGRGWNREHSIITSPQNWGARYFRLLENNFRFRFMRLESDDKFRNVLVLGKDFQFLTTWKNYWILL